ncbi:MAG: hypothetical protein P4L92_04455 [Rudaea sp.]|nr:hypothetical protein [Rudaea sp.]
MGRFLNLLWEICRLRRGPQDLPYSPQLLLGVCVASLVLQQAITRVLGVDQDTLGAGMLSLAFNLGVLYLLLNLRGLRSRFIQAALALLCCALLFTLLSLPIALLAGTHPITPEQMTPLQLLLGLASLPLLIWKLMVDAHILRHSLDVPFLAGMVIALLWLVAELTLATVIGGAPATA